MLCGVTGVQLHRDTVLRALAAHKLGRDELPLLVTHPDIDAGIRLSGLLVLLADTADDPADAGPVVTVAGHEDPGVDWLGRDRGAWTYLGSVTLPWTAETATLALRLVTGCEAFDDRRVNLVLRGTGRVCAAGQADPPLLDALQALRTYLAGLGEEHHRVKEMRALSTRVVALASHPDLLDLSALLDGDTWAPAARAAAQRAAEQEGPEHEGPGHETSSADIAALVRLLVALGPRKPPKKWRQETRRVLAATAAQALLREWLQAAAVADIVPEWPGSSLTECRGVLFMASNIDVVRAAVWATLFLPEEQWQQPEQPVPTSEALSVEFPSGPPGEVPGWLTRPWPAEVLGVLARRGAANNGLPGFPEALALKVASASVDVLIARDGQAERDILAELLEDLQRRDLLKKIGAHLGRSDEVDQRSQMLVKQRAVDQRAKANPAPRKARAARDSMIRQHLGPTLRALGFTGGPTTWKRTHDDRVDEVSVSASVQYDGQNRVYLSYGAHFVAMDNLHESDADSSLSGWESDPGGLHLSVYESDQAEDETEESAPGGAEPGDAWKDSWDDDGPVSALGARHDPVDAFSPQGLAALTERVATVVVPFLDSLGSYQAALAALDGDNGLPPGSYQHANPGSFGRHLRVGTFALAHGDRPTAVRHLDRAIALAEGFQDDEPGDGWASHALAVAQWKRKRAQDLP